MADGGVYVNSNGDWVRAGGAGGGGGIDVESEREHQLLQGDDAKGWVPGMAMSVVDAVPADSVGEIGDVVFVTGPGDGGSPLPGVGGGKVLQVVTEWDTTDHETAVSNTPVDTGHSLSITPINANSKILITAQYVCEITKPDGYTSGWGQIKIVDEADAVMQGAERSRFGMNDQVEVNWSTLSHVLHLVGVDQISSTDTKTYRTQFWPTGGADTMKIRNELNTGLLMAIEVSP
jgi:hypothetical protein